ncbi:MAG: DNRLRE domain-containing protein [Pseudomonadota bacterium]
MAGRGYVLLPVVLLLALIAVAALMLNDEAVLEVRATAGADEQAQAVYTARAGLQHALQQVATAGCGPYADLSDEPFGSQRYSTTVTTNSVSGLITTVSVPVSDDAWTDYQSKDTNHGSDNKLRLEGSLLGGNYKWPYYRFDLENAGIPAGATIVSAVARWYVLRFDHTSAVQVHRVTADWDETTVTWNSVSSSIDIATAATIPAGTPINQYVDVNLTAQVQAWVNGSQPNYGVVITPPDLLGSKTSEFTSKEDSTASQRPYLELKYVDGSLSDRASVTATGTLDSGASHTIVRAEVPLYQPTVTFVLQPGGAGNDTYLANRTGNEHRTNYGNGSELRVSTSGGHTLLDFELQSLLPPGAQIQSATLELNFLNADSFTAPVGMSLYPVRAAWEEMTATWDDRQTGVSWATPGGDYQAVAAATTSVDGVNGSWYGWDLTALAQTWLDNPASDRGMLLKAVSGNAVNARFASSDHSDPSLHPRLSVTLACECGVTCMLPQGTGSILLVVGNAVSPAAADLKKQALFEAWGYVVNLIDDEASQTSFDSALANNDMAYVSETVSDSDLGNKLAATARAVISEERNQLDNLGMASAGSEAVTSQIEITDNTHYITAVFPLGVIPLGRAPMEGQIVSGTPAPGLQVLGRLNGTSSLAVVEAGGTLAGGGTAPGPRAMLPVGRSDKFNWDYLNNNGRLLIQRAIQWGVDAILPTPPKKVYWTDDVANKIQRADEDGSNVEDVLTGLNRPTGLDIDTVNGKLYWTNNYQIMRADLDGSNSEVLYSDLYVKFDIKLDVAGGKMYWTHDNGSSRIMSANLDGSAATLVNNTLNRPSCLTLDKAAGHIYLTEFGSGQVSRMKFNGTQVTTLATGPTGAVGSALDLVHGRMFWSGGASNDWIKRANLDGSSVQTIVTGLNAPQDIAYDADNDRIYWVDALNMLVQRADPDGSNVETLVSGLARPRGIVLVNADQVPPTGSGGGSGGGGSGSGGCNGTFRDEFNAQVYSGSDGTLTWASDWIEVNEADGPTLNDERVFADLYESPPMPTYQLHVRDNDGGGEGVMRALDLSGAATATLSFDYKPAGLDDSGDYASIQMSTAGASGPWTEVARIAGPANETAYQPYSVDISAYNSANAVLRILTSPNMGSSDYVFFDNIQIQCAP